MKTAIHFGAGNIGRGFIGALLSTSGYRVIFVDIVDEIIDALKDKQQYTVEIAGDEIKQQIITNVTALHAVKDSIDDSIAQADIITTAVGPNVLPIVAKSIVAGIQKRSKDSIVPIIACENAVGASSLLEKHTLAHIPQDELKVKACFVNCAVDRVVPNFKTDDILSVRVEEYYEWLTDKHAFIGELPNITGMTAVDNLEAGIMRKMFTLNTGHSILAWLFAKSGIPYIKDIVNNAPLAQIAECAMRESGAYLIDRFGFGIQKYNDYVVKILKRFHNVHINDDVFRVGRQPIRKLSQNERIFQPVFGALQKSFSCDKLLVGAAAGLHFFNEDDEESVQQQKAIQNKGVEKVLDEYISENMPQRKELINKVCFYYNNIDKILKGEII